MIASSLIVDRADGGKFVNPLLFPITMNTTESRVKTVLYDPIFGKIEITRDERGKIASVLKEDGEITLYEFDSEGRLIRVSSEESIVIYEYRDNGKLAKVESLKDVFHYKWDENGNLIDIVCEEKMCPTGS